MDTVRETVRANTRLSSDLNDWLDNESKMSGLSKSSIIMMATENYRREKLAMQSMADIGDLVAKIEAMEKTIQQKGLD